MSYAYLQHGLCDENGLRAELDPHIDSVARAWLAARLDASIVEVLSEYLARLAKEMGTVSVTPAQLVESAAHVGTLGPMRELVLALPPLTARDVFALAVHLLDIAERMALLTYLPELPAMTAQAVRTGDAARNVGLARHLKG